MNRLNEVLPWLAVAGLGGWAAWPHLVNAFARVAAAIRPAGTVVDPSAPPSRAAAIDAVLLLHDYGAAVGSDKICQAMHEISGDILTCDHTHPAEPAP